MLLLLRKVRMFVVSIVPLGDVPAVERCIIIDDDTRRHQTHKEQLPLYDRPPVQHQEDKPLSNQFNILC
jgi:hypothetical protein